MWSGNVNFACGKYNLPFQFWKLRWSLYRLRFWKKSEEPVFEFFWAENKLLQFWTFKIWYHYDEVTHRLQVSSKTEVETKFRWTELIWIYWVLKMNCCFFEQWKFRISTRGLDFEKIVIKLLHSDSMFFTKTDIRTWKINCCDFKISNFDTLAIRL